MWLSVLSGGRFEDGAGSIFEIDSGVGGPASDMEMVVSDTFASGLQFSSEAGPRFQNQHGWLLRASASVWAREVGLPTSSSETISRTMR